MARLWISVLVFMMIQAVLFGVGAVLVLATPLKDVAMQLMPVVVIASAIVAIPIAWLIAPRLQARYWRRLGRKSDAISGPAPSAAD